MRLVVAASGDFALPTFEALPAGGHEVLALVTQPDRPSGRGRHVEPSRIKQAAEELGIAVLQPQRIAAPEVVDRVAELAPDVFLVIAYGQKIPASICRLPPLGAINLHGSLLPELRGAAPINWAILRGFHQTGVTVQFLAERIDAGDVLGRREVAVRPRETAPELHDRLAVLGAGLVLDVLRELESGVARPETQDESRASFAPKLRKEDGLVDWGLCADELDCRVRGLKPWPCAYTYLNHPGKPPLRVILDEAISVDASGVAGASQAAPGTIVAAGHELVVAAGKGLLRVISLKPESGKVMSAEAFANGHGVKVGDVLGTPRVEP